MATILVVDDEVDVRTLCRVNLEYEGYGVIEANDGQQGLEVARREKPDLILLDLMMPNLDGWQVIEALKEDESTARIPVVLLTAKTDEASQLRGFQEGVFDYITKPFNPLVLSRYVEKALNEDQEEAERRRQLISEELKRMQELRKKEEGDHGA